RGVLGPAREIDENTTVRRHRHAGHLAIETGGLLEAEAKPLASRRQGLFGRWRLGTDQAGRRDRQAASQQESTVDHWSSLGGHFQANAGRGGRLREGATNDRSASLSLRR